MPTYEHMFAQRAALGGGKMPALMFFFDSEDPGESREARGLLDRTRLPVERIDIDIRAYPGGVDFKVPVVVLPSGRRLTTIEEIREFASVSVG